MDIEKNISIFVEDQFSSNYRENGALLVEFMECYYKWAQESGNFVDASRSLNTLYDVDEIADEFLDFLHNEFLGILPKDLKTNKRTLIKNILSFYQSRGTEDAYRLLFRILYNQEINLYYPSKDILRASDGKWYIGKKLKIIPSYTGEYTDIPEIIGATSGATARIENSIELIEGLILVTYLYLTNIRGTFVQGEDIKIRYQDTIIGFAESDGILTDPGYWINTDGHLSSDKYLQDNFYYQAFSYEIQSSIPVVEYRDIATKTVHPAGTKLFGKVLANYILDLTYLDVNFGDGIISANDNAIVIDTSDLDVIYEEKMEFEHILDREIQEVSGLGLLSINDGQILDFNGLVLGEFGTVPINLIGSRQLIIGTGTNFTTEIAQPNGPIPGSAQAVIKISDGDNTLISDHTVHTSFSDRFLSIESDYIYPSFTLEPYSIFRTIPEAAMGYVEFVDILGTGTITWNNGTQLFDGTGTIFNMEVSREDVIEIISTGERYLVTGVGDDNLLSIFTGESTLTATIVNQPFRVYKNFTNPGESDGDYVTWNAQFLQDGFDYLVYTQSEYIDGSGDNWIDDFGNLYVGR